MISKPSCFILKINLESKLQRSTDTISSDIYIYIYKVTKSMLVEYQIQYGKINE